MFTVESKNLRSGARKVSKLGRKSYFTESCLNFQKLGNSFFKVSGENVPKSEQTLTIF